MEPKITKSRFRGVYRCGKRWKAQLQSQGVQFYLGTFDTEEAAAKAYDRKAREEKGLKSQTNFNDDGDENAEYDESLEPIEEFHNEHMNEDAGFDRALIDANSVLNYNLFSSHQSWILWERLNQLSQRLLLTKAAQLKLTDLQNQAPDNKKAELLKNLNEETNSLLIVKGHLEEALSRYFFRDHFPSLTPSSLNPTTPKKPTNNPATHQDRENNQSKKPMPSLAAGFNALNNFQNTAARNEAMIDNRILETKAYNEKTSIEESAQSGIQEIGQKRLLNNQTLTSNNIWFSFPHASPENEGTSSNSNNLNSPSPQKGVFPLPSVAPLVEKTLNSSSMKSSKSEEKNGGKVFSVDKNQALPLNQLFWPVPSSRLSSVPTIDQLLLPSYKQKINIMDSTEELKMKKQKIGNPLDGRESTEVNPVRQEFQTVNQNGEKSGMTDSLEINLLNHGMGEKNGLKIKSGKEKSKKMPKGLPSRSTRVTKVKNGEILNSQKINVNLNNVEKNVYVTKEKSELFKGLPNR